MGWAYGGGQALVGKKVLVSMTTGAPDFAWTAEKRGTIKEIFKHLFVGTFGLCGMQPLEPFIVYGAKRVTEQDKINTFDAFRKRLESV
jgi:putative NADPH-quinone reductase